MASPADGLESVVSYPTEPLTYAGSPSDSSFEFLKTLGWNFQEVSLQLTSIPFYHLLTSEENSHN